MTKPKPKSGDAFLAMTPQLSPVHPGGSNLVFSPLSLQVVLGLLASGANPAAAEQILSFLKLESLEDLDALSSRLISKVLVDNTRNSPTPTSTCYYSDDEIPDFEISLANGIWIHEGYSLKQSFKQVVDNVYHADLFPSDFVNKGEKIKSEVNSWAADKSHGLIQDILGPQPLPEDQRLILANALYFKAPWLEEYFDESATKDNDFHLLDGTSVKVPFMTNYDPSHLLIGLYDGFNVLLLHYDNLDNRHFCMYILLPDAVDGLAALEARVGSEPDFIKRHKPHEHVDAEEFRVPKFKIAFDFSVTGFLERFGVTLPFEIGAMDRMVEGSPEELVVTDIRQKTVIEVNEKGTLAATISVGDCMGCSLESPPRRKRIDFVADHPFMFVIQEVKSGAMLFVGHVLNPLEEPED